MQIEKLKKLFTFYLLRLSIQFPIKSPSLFFPFNHHHCCNYAKLQLSLTNTSLCAFSPFHSIPTMIIDKENAFHFLHMLKRRQIIWYSHAIFAKSLPLVPSPITIRIPITWMFEQKE